MINSLKINDQMVKTEAKYNELKENLVKVVSTQNPFAKTPVEGACYVGTKVNPVVATLENPVEKEAAINAGILAFVESFLAQNDPAQVMEFIQRPDGKPEADDKVYATLTVGTFAKILTLIANRKDYTVIRAESGKTPEKSSEKVEQSFDW